MDLEPVLKKFPPLTTENTEDPEFEQLETVLCWKDLHRLFNKVVVDKSTREAKTLSASIHYLSTQFALKSAENTGLRASLQGKKKHKVKGQVLPSLTNNSGSLTLSPATVEKALEALAQKDQEAEEELARKARSKAARQAARENKLALQAVAAETRKVDKEKREKVKEEKAQKIAQRKREREEARSIPPPPKKRKQASEPASNRPPKKQAIRQPGGSASGVGSGEVGSEATPVSSPKVIRSGRINSIPSKFG
jgi:pyruvate/2-oxoglutarate dehydrogenase complex dihydrolipoamide acyltransferase (E2) component